MVILLIILIEQSLDDCSIRVFVVVFISVHYSSQSVLVNYCDDMEK